MAGNITSPLAGDLVYQLSYVQGGGNNLGQVENWDVDLMDGGKDIYTLFRGRAGRVQGACSAKFSISGYIPSNTPDVGGAGMFSQDMLIGSVPMDQTMLTPYNANNSQPITLGFFIGPPTNYTTKLVLTGNITDIKFTGKLGEPGTFAATGTANYFIWSI